MKRFEVVDQRRLPIFDGPGCVHCIRGTETFFIGTDDMDGSEVWGCRFCGGETRVVN